MKFRLPVDFRPGRQGLGKVLGTLENEIMEIIWRKGCEVSVRDVHEVLVARREVAYTTVMTIMGRLADKKLLHKRKEGKAFYFLPSLTREGFTEKVVGSVVDSLLEDFADATLAHLVNRVSARDQETLARLEKMLAVLKNGEGHEVK
ncbi:MAG: BlaI/MecI/CopY family transcriptional regulator [Firmicutes bacterium]|nr:BlaI/MecI/CopY family transcriptional regulator [Bacillota bacterium]